MENISKQVISLQDKRVVGYILKPYIDYSILSKTGYIVVDEDNEEEYLLREEDIITNSQNVVIESHSVLEFIADSSPLRKKIFTDCGEDLGRIKSFTFCKNKIKKIITDKCEINPSYIKEAGYDLIIVSLKRKKKSFPRFENENIKVEIMDKKEVSAPPVVNLSPIYFIGKTAFKTLLGLNSELIIKEGGKVTKQIFEKAKMHNRLNQLFFIIK